MGGNLAMQSTIKLYLRPSDSSRAFQCVLCGGWSTADSLAIRIDEYSDSRVCAHCATGGDKSSWLVRARAQALRALADWLENIAGVLCVGQWPTKEELAAYRELPGTPEQKVIEVG